MQERVQRIGAFSASLIGVVLLWLAYEQWSDLRTAGGLETLFLVSVTILGVGLAIGLSLSFSGFRTQKSIWTLLLAIWPFSLLLLYFWYWISDLLIWSTPSWLVQFVLSEPVMILSPTLVGVAVGLAIGSRTMKQPVDMTEVDLSASH